jgi:hypothetical protein
VPVADCKEMEMYEFSDKKTIVTDLRTFHKCEENIKKIQNYGFKA